jgi:hypothetical protein
MIAVSRQFLHPAFEQVSILDPALLRPRDIPEPLNVINHVAKLAGHQDFIFRADIVTPVDIDILRNGLERPFAVKPSASLRPVVMVMDSLMRLSITLCFAMRAWILVMPGITSYSSSNPPLAFSLSRMRNVLS